MSRSGGRAPSQRQLRVGESLRHGLALVLARADFADPDLAGTSITVTEVRVSPDLKQATAFVTPLGGEAMAASVKALNRATGFIRARLAEEVVLKSLPRLSFKADQSFDQADRMRGLLDQPRVRRDTEPAPVGEAGHGSEEDPGDGA